MRELHERMGVNLVLLARLYRRALDGALKPYELSEATVLPMRYIARLGDNIRQGTLADVLNLEGPTLVRVLDQLTELGYIDRIEDPQDRRAKTLRLTAAGQARNTELSNVLAKLRAELFEGASEDDVNATLRVMSQLDANLQRRRRLEPTAD
ncbi:MULTISPECIES: MarR family transcriptional regulator [unclassified Rhizobium]|uniref:MarR family transcriptional regulator n=1 Tax=unclassified Rhizobium TaxID=2613769 RepID=UPI001ADAE737|nr:MULTISPECIES: MarR family transcriptional regulator [unclassified Rhizobium]MBO9100684.1 winged helix DNA-binding protein [Rhizobium sp. L58/93]MBO9171266.1 winged helix DNA-binding protein [Rhizobium sp. L245/93]MBO9187133.1 winged helix DNA-binding protein [Rhizobium sp. E27B/91]QXZ88101.1 winged helix DNA-binding protein [Rhizobium sp. K1/93]QXZ93977.1 winged helix DNA-binding protein [Rhizobium sp. K15/93]